MKSIQKAQILGLILLGSSTAFAQTRKVESTKGIEQTDNNKIVKIEGVGHNANYTLNGGIVDVEGGDNIITIKGSARKISISGTGNKIYIDRVDKVAIEGGDNAVFYKTSGTKSGKPNTSLSGVGNTVTKQ